MAQQTAVEYYADKQLELHQKLKDNQISMIDFVVKSRDLLIESNEKFKQQIENAQMDMFNHINDKKFGMDYFHKRDAALIYAEDYYNETYGNNIKQ